MKKLILFLLTMPLLAATNLQAQGTAFTYQGWLDAIGIPANGSYDFQFIVYDNNTGGSQQGPILTNTATGVSNGVFTVTLDFGQIFPGANRWLDIAVRTNGGSSFAELTPRQPLTPAPYAITAGSVMSGASGLAGTYGGAVTLSNASNNITGAFTGTFVGNGTNITNVNAATLNGLNSGNFWQSGGNNVVGGQFLGSTNNQPLELRANNSPIMRFAYVTNSLYGLSPNVIGGMSANFVGSGVLGATISGGGSSAFGTNRVLGNYGTVLGGYGNEASGESAIAGGTGSYASAENSVALGGSAATGDGAVAMGYSSATGATSVALNQSVTGGDFSFSMGYSEADGDYSFAGGTGAYVTNDGCFVWADQSNNNGLRSTADNQFIIRAAGGVILQDISGTDLNFGNATRQMINLFGTGYGVGVQNSTLYQRSNSRFSWFKGGVHSDTENTPGAGGSVLMTLTSGGLIVNGTLASTSDRNAKQDFAEVNSREVLDKVAALPITKWNYKTDSDTRHIGPMAQDFYAAFAVGPDDKHITTVDEGGVALAAIQGLNQKLNDKDAEIQDLRQKNQELETKLDDVRRMVEALASKK